MNLYGTSEAARRLNTTRDRLLRLLDRKRLPEPKLRIGGHRAFCERELAEMSAILQGPAAQKAVTHECPPSRNNVPATHNSLNSKD